MIQDEKTAGMGNSSSTDRSADGPHRGTFMTVRQMGELLGLKRTEWYWLLHKNVFETRIIHGKTMVNVASFEKWYAGQIHYRKVTGEEPGRLINAATYSIRDITGLLGISESRVYALIKREHLETVAVDFRMRVPREVFDQWYASQSRYHKADEKRNEDDRSHLDDVVGLEDHSKNPDTDTNEFTGLAEQKPKDTDKRKNRNARRKYPADYISIAEAAEIAGVTRQAISKLADRGKIACMKTGSMIRIQRLDFEKWLQGREARH